MRFIFATIVFGLITFLAWPWITEFFKYTKLKYNEATNFKEKNETTVQESEASKSNVSTKENENESN